MAQWLGALSLHPPATPIPGYVILSSGLQRHQTHVDKPTHGCTHITNFFFKSKIQKEKENRRNKMKALSYYPWEKVK